jgi:cell wall-associated NlpC family hydrolase
MEIDKLKIKRIGKPASSGYGFIQSVYTSRKNKHLPVLAASLAVVILAAAVTIFIVVNPLAQAGKSVHTNPGPTNTGNPVDVTPAASSIYPTKNSSFTVVPSPFPTLIPTLTPDPTLKRGDVDERVQLLQQRLMNLGYLDIDETTLKFGPATELAVNWFQRQHKLTQTGIADGATLALIYSDQAKRYTLLEGTKGSDVDSLQRRLIALGYMNKATGYYGTETIAAVKAFQKQNRLVVDGKTGEKTLSLVYSPKAKLSPQMIAAARRAANITRMIEVAVDQLGKSYVAGNEGPNSFDCSGLVYYCLRQAGSNIGRYNAAGYSEVDDWAKISSMSNLQKGDLLFFWDKSRGMVGHVAIYIGGGMMIDASSSNGMVVKRSCTSSWCEREFVWARRPW